ncbi:MAG: M20/M25/M40 family metallo-hydrolase, partial [Flavobacteriia bacterium]|nr:M20/M25/M40 family metallo-hydrolase [Flavobacteriia bacterium]
MTVRNTSIRLASGLLLPLLFGATLHLQAQDAPKLSKQALQLQTDVKTLADDAMEGRKVGTKGEKKASEYLVKRFKEMGLTGAISDSKTPYFDPFEAQPSVHGTPTGPKITGRNVVAVLPGQGEGTIYIGAHYDHWGWGGEGSLYRGADSAIHNGADDNASGVAAVLELARRFHDSPLQNTVVFIAFSGEEMGLWGSNAFAKEHLGAFPAPRFMVNMDMVGRLKEDRSLAVYGVGTSPVFAQTLNANNEGFKLVLNESGIGPSDHTSFYLADVPVLHFFTGQHEDYHKPTDDVEKVNFEGMAVVGDFILNLISSLNWEGKLEFTKTQQKDSQKAPKFSVTLGVMPDYMFDGDGMRIDGIIDDRPAQKAGLQKGDVVTKMGDVDVEGMRGYMEALSKFQKGDKAKIEVIREG